MKFYIATRGQFDASRTMYLVLPKNKDSRPYWSSDPVRRSYFTDKRDGYAAVGQWAAGNDGDTAFLRNIHFEVVPNANYKRARELAEATQAGVPHANVSRAYLDVLDVLEDLHDRAQDVVDSYGPFERLSKSLSVANRIINDAASD